MSNQSEAGRKAWETRHANDAREVRERYQACFRSPSKSIGRNRGIRALKAAGGSVCLTLWGGGLDIGPAMITGMSVIAVENGSHGVDNLSIAESRTKNALEWDALERGFRAAWGSVATFAREADVALLDFCGGLGKANRDAIRACRHMKAIVVTLTTGHDIVTRAVASEKGEAAGLSQEDRRVMFEALLRRTYGSTRCRRLATYKSGKQVVWMYLLSHEPVDVPRLTNTERRRLDPSFAERDNARHRAWNRAKDYWRNLPAEKKAERQAANAEYRHRRMADPEYAARIRQLDREKAARWRALHPEESRATSRASHAKRRAEAERRSES